MVTRASGLAMLRYHHLVGKRHATHCRYYIRLAIQLALMLIEIIMMLICRFRYILTSTLRQIKQTLAWVRSAANPAARIPTCIQPLPFSKTKGHGTSVRSAPIHCRPCYKSHTTHNTAKCSSVGSGTKRFVPLTSSPHSTCFAVGVLAKRKRSVTIDNCTSLRRAQVKTSTPDDGRTGEKICTYNLEPIWSDVGAHLRARPLAYEPTRQLAH